ncbi:MAG: HD domain-containing protein, partial [Acidobacteriota bacterium]
MTDTGLTRLDESALRARLLARVAPNQIIERATAIAGDAHRGRLRDEGTPYVCHVLRTALILAEELHISDTERVCAALLHDVLEDGVGIALEQLRETFGERVAAMVHCLTDEFKHSGLPRAERKRLYLQRIAGADDDCLVVKLCDRLDNLRSLPDSPSLEKREQVSRETRVHLMPGLSQRSGPFSVLNRLLQEALHYEALCRYRDLRPDCQLLSDHIEKVLLAMAHCRGIYPIVTARAKSLESFAEKIQRPGKVYAVDPVTEITDLCGVRVIVHTLDQVDAMAAAV